LDLTGLVWIYRYIALSKVIDLEMRPESVCSESGHESEKPGREISRRIDGVAAVVAEGDADVQHNKPDLKLNN
jgi:hypothetical protein